MKLQGRNLKLDLHGADVRLLQFELRLLDLEIPDEEADENHFGEGTQQAVVEFQSIVGVAPKEGVVERETARSINSSVSGNVSADEALERLLQAVERTLDQIGALDPDTGDLRAQIERFSKTLRAFTIALEELRDRDASEDLAEGVEERLEDGRSQLKELADSLDGDGDNGASYIVFGQVLRTDGTPFGDTGYSIGAVDVVPRLNERMPLGSPVSLQPNGTYQIPYAWESTGGRNGPNLLVRLYNPEGEAVAEGTRPVANRRETLDLEVDLPTPAPEPGDNAYIVRGRIVSHELRGLADLRAVVVDRNVSGDVRLGEGTSGERGAYEISYSIASLQKEKPDVQVQIIDDNEEVLAHSATRYNASRKETGLDIVIPEEKLSRSAEYARLIGELGAQLGNPDDQQLKQRLAGLKEDDEQQDITYLANKTGWDARMVAMTSLASQFGERSGIDPEFYYVLFRGGVPANEAVLSQMSPEAVRQAWERAIEQEILPAELERKIPESLERFKDRSTTGLLKEPAQIGISNFKELIEGSLGDADGQERFARLYYQQRDDLENFWESVREEFPDEAERLQLDGKLGFLTINNAPLTQRLHEQNGDLNTPLDLVRHGFYRSEAWEELLDDDAAVPDEIAGEGPEEKKVNYADYMADQLRLSYPTAVVTEMVRSDAIPLGAEESVKTAVTEFLDEHQGRFELGIHPVEQYLLKNEATLDEPVLAEVKKLQRVYQITPSEETTGKLLEHNLDSARTIANWDQQLFIDTFEDELGGEAVARLIHAKAHQVHHTVLNIAISYALQRSAPALYATDSLPARNGSGDGNGSGNGNGGGSVTLALTAEDTGVVASRTLEEVFGELDYCACEHCRSWLSPAAYLVDLLLFLDPPTHEKDNPLDVLLGRRPDIQHLQLTCENTNTVLPYIDLVNEVLEHYVVNGSLVAFEGHDVEEGTTTEDLLAKPQFVESAAYDELRDNQVFPPPLPFHQPLEALRRYFEHFDVPLHEAMQRLRKDDAIERTDGVTDPAAYGWRDILMEQLQISRQEHHILTDSSTPLQRLYGEPGAVTVDDLISNLVVSEGDEPRGIGISNAKLFSRTLDLSYEELIEIIRTRFVNPHSDLIPKLEKLHVDFAAIQAFIDGARSEESEEAFEGLLPEDLDVAAYGGDVKAWVRDSEAQIMSLIVLSDPTGSEDICSFDTMELRYALPDFDNNTLRPVEFFKLLRFIRLWRKLGWTIEQTDKAITALYPADQRPEPADDYEDAGTKLDTGFQTLLLRLAHLHTTMGQLKLPVRRDLMSLLACWVPIDTHGHRSLYRQMFLNPTILALDDAFKEDGYGNYLADKREYQPPEVDPPRLLHHVEALRAAFNLTQEEFDLILQELDLGDDPVLNLANVSAIFRHGYLARKLRLSVQELLALKVMSGLDPFQPLDLAQPPDPDQPLDAVRPPAIRLIELAQRIKDSPLKVAQLRYLLQHVDPNGEASPSQEDIRAFARTLRNDLLRIDREHGVQDDPTGEIARDKMALVYDGEVTDVFFGLLNNTSLFSATYVHWQTTLEEDILAVTDRIAYGDFQKLLSFKGVMTDAEKEDLDRATSATDDFRDFRTAVQALFDEGREAFAAFFERYPDLRGLYANFVDSDAPLADKMSALLADFLPDLRARLKEQQVRQTVSAHVGAELTMVTPLLEGASLLHAVGSPTESAVSDFLKLETQGLSADIFFGEDVTVAADQTDIVSTIDYREATAALPRDPADENAPVSGVWRGFLEAPDNGFYNFYIDADTGAEISLVLDEEEVTLAPNDDGVLENQDAIELEAGLLYELELTAKSVRDVLVLRWERRGMGRAPIPEAQLYPAAPLEHFTTSYLRLLKALAIADALALSSNDLAHFASHGDYSIDGEGWLNALSVSPSSATATTRVLLKNVLALLQYCELKETLKVRDEALLEFLQDPLAVGEEDEVPLLARVTGWREADLTDLLNRFGLTREDLGHLGHFSRVHTGLEIVAKLGIGAGTLIAVTTNDPAVDTVRTLQAALRARYDQSGWLKVIQPLNDELRSLQRDALVAYVLHRLGQSDATRHIDTPDKLFEYFLIDVQMDPCMKTSRIKQALSSVQLFVQHCLLNLEPRVASSSIDAKQWQWIKRYRVWEANRKVFLWPENWLEPELRDNKSPFFKDLESELLEGDITDDAAATALVHYLEKLDEVAKLEICGMYYEENKLDNEADDIVHVIARTAGARRTYYYRRQEGGSAWTPWEKIDLNIEDNPVLPVVWNGRLFLFWVSVLQEAPPEPTSSATGDEEMDLTAVTPAQLRGVAGEPRTRVAVTLYWSEYYYGKWQPARTSDLNNPLVIGDFTPSVFDRAKLELWSTLLPLSEESRGTVVTVGYDGLERAQYRLYNTHSSPIIDTRYLVIDPTRDRDFSDDARVFNVVYRLRSALAPSSIRRDILKNALLHETNQPRHAVTDIIKSPFFFQDRRHVFFVTSKERRPLIQGYLDIGFEPSAPVGAIETPVVVVPDFYPPLEEVSIPPDLIIPGLVDPISGKFVRVEESNVDRFLNTGATLLFGNRVIGAHGGTALEGNFR